MNDSFVFYKSFLEMAEFISDAEQKLALYEGVIQYAIRGIEPQFYENHTFAKMAFAGIKPQIDANNKRKADGKKGGRPTGKTDEKPVVIEDKNHRLKNEKPNVNVNGNVNGNNKEKNKKENGDKSLFDFSLNLSFGSSEAFLDAWKRWETYRREKKLAKWTESTLVAKVKVFEQWGEAKTIQSIEQSIANGWQGLFEPKGDNPKEPISLEDFRKAYRKVYEYDFDADFCEEMPHHLAVLKADLDTLKTKFKSDYDSILADWNKDFSKLKKAVRENKRL
jgi:hypothetical protein